MSRENYRIVHRDDGWILVRNYILAILMLVSIGVGIELIVFIDSIRIPAKQTLVAVAGTVDGYNKLAATLNEKAEGLPPNSAKVLDENLAFLRTEIRALRLDTTNLASTSMVKIDNRLGQVVDKVDIKPFQTSVAEIGDSIKVTLEPYKKLGEDVARSQLILQPEVTTLLRGWGVTGYEAATTFKDVRKAIPEVLTEIERTTKGSAESTEQSAIFFHNMAQATTPLPRWLRIGLAVAPPVAQTVFAGVAASRY
jgi:hypothetical protein